MVSYSDLQLRRQPRRIPRMPTPSSEQARVWCHCKISCRVPRQVSQRTYFRHNKLAKQAQYSTSTDHTGSTSRKASSAGPSKRLRCDDSDDDVDIEDVNNEPEVSILIILSSHNLTVFKDPPVLVPDDTPLREPGPPPLAMPSLVEPSSQAGDERLDDGFDDEVWTPEPPQASSPELEQSDLDEATRAAVDLGSLADLDSDGTEDRPMAGNRTGQDIEDDEPPPVLHIDELRTSQAFIDALQGASLDDENLHPDVLERLRNPPTEEYRLDDPVLHLSLEIFLGLDRASEVHYDLFRSAVARSHNIQMLSLHQVKRAVQDISGVRAVYDDMCINSCVAYTGPFASRDTCPECGENRYDQLKLVETGNKIARQRALTNVIGPQLQAMWRTPAGAKAMKYRADCTRKLMEDVELTANGIKVIIPVYSDYLHGAEYLAAVGRGDITDTDTVLMLSIDGAQLYRSKQSDCWIYIWVNYNRAPDNRYKLASISVGGVIPGPRKPKNLESFLFTGLHHVLALINEGLVIWDADTLNTFVSRIFFAFLTADGPGMSSINGLVGHSGAQHCRLYCGMKGRLKPGTGIYYPVCLLPSDYAQPGSMHPDIDIFVLSLRDHQETVESYKKNLREVQESPNLTQYRARRLKTGIVKPTILSALPPDRIFPIPGCFPADIMHLAALNIPDLLISLWRGTMTCEKGDSRDTWGWAVFRDLEVWRTHGRAVAAATPYLPTSYDRPPRNPAEKINTGYKAIEYLTYLFVLGPGLFYGLLPFIRLQSHSHGPFEAGTLCI